MNHKKLHAFFALKWNPFSQELPVEALMTTPKIEHFAWRLEQQVFHGGFAMIAGEPGTGKSVALRLVAERLSALRDVSCGAITRPQSKVPDLYREMGEIFGVKLSPVNRWGGFKSLRERWKTHVETTLMRPVLLIDEAQEMPPHALSEMRILQSANFDSISYLTVVLAGDDRLVELLATQELLPVGSRMRARLHLTAMDREELLDLLEKALDKAGNRNLLTREVKETMVEHCAGNLRSLMIMGGELLEAAMAREISEIDEKLYLEVFASPAPLRKATRRVKSRAAR
jgi:type II secretory pathway predicted ATPase ExeA